MMHLLASAILTKKFVGISSFSLFIIALTDPTAFAAAAVLVIGAIGGAAVLVITALGKMRTDILDKQTALEVAQNEIKATVETVKHATDGMTTAAAAKRTADEDTITSLRDQLNKSESRAERLAQSTGSAAVAAASQTPIAPTLATQHLDNIETNTAATADNTKRTEAVVQDLKDKA